MSLFLIRHPKPDIPSGVCYGATDVGLAQEPGACAERLRNLLPKRYALYSSPLQRARRLAQELGSPIEDSRLREMNFGEWENQRYDNLRNELDDWAADPLGFRPPRGETGLEVADRIWDFHRDTVEQHQEEHVVVVSHSGPLRLWLAQLLGVPHHQHHIFRLDYARLTRVELSANHYQLSGLNL